MGLKVLEMFLKMASFHELCKWHGPRELDGGGGGGGGFNWAIRYMYIY